MDIIQQLMNIVGGITEPLMEAVKSLLGALGGG